MLTEFDNARFLVVDDEEHNIKLLERILERAGYKQYKCTTDPRDALPIFLEWEPDIVLLDLHMPHIDGFTLLEDFRHRTSGGAHVPVLVLTGDVSAEVRRRALASGAKDFLSKPFDVAEVLLRIKNLLETRFLHLQLLRQNELLEQRVRERTRELEGARIEILERLARAAEFRDDDTGQHTQRVGRISALVARSLGLPPEQVDLIRRAAPLHDVGKIGIPDSILLRPGRLGEREFEVMRTHTYIGARILSGSRFPLLDLASTIALTHHERWDGTGYPKGLKGEAIPIVGRIVAVADVFDALTHDRPYKPAWPVEQALAEIEQQAGYQFDPQVVEAFLESLRRMGFVGSSSPANTLEVAVAG